MWPIMSDHSARLVETATVAGRVETLYKMAPSVVLLMPLLLPLIFGADIPHSMRQHVDSSIIQESA